MTEQCGKGHTDTEEGGGLNYRITERICEGQKSNVQRDNLTSISFPSNFFFHEIFKGLSLNIRE